MKSDIQLNLSQIQDGMLQKKLNIELAKVFENIHDDTRDPTSKRTIEIKMEFEPNIERDSVVCTSKIKTKLVPVNDTSMTLATGRDNNTGYIRVREIESGLPGQTFIGNDGRMRTDEGNVVDFNK